MYAEYTILTKYFGTESMSIWFNNYQGYQDAREKAMQDINSKKEV